MASNDRPDPMEILGQLFQAITGGVPAQQAAGDAWRRATEPRPAAKPSAEQQRENLAFALAERAVTALEDIALNTAAIRQRLGGADILNPVNKPAARPDPFD